MTELKTKTSEIDNDKLTIVNLVKFNLNDQDMDEVIE